MRAPPFVRASPEVLKPVTAERGYELAMHHVLATIGPEILDAYTRIYRRAALSAGPSVIDREAVWLALLATDPGPSPGVHATRAIAGGMAPDAVAWLQRVFKDPARLPTDESEVPGQLRGGPYALATVAFHAANRDETSFFASLMACGTHGVESARVAEALLPVMLNCGAGAFQWACDAWARLESRS